MISWLILLAVVIFAGARPCDIPLCPFVPFVVNPGFPGLTQVFGFQPDFIAS